MALILLSVESMRTALILRLLDCPEWKTWSRHLCLGSKIVLSGEHGNSIHIKALRMSRRENLELAPLLWL